MKRLLFILIPTFMFFSCSKVKSDKIEGKWLFTKVKKCNDDINSNLDIEEETWEFVENNKVNYYINGKLQSINSNNKYIPESYSCCTDKILTINYTSGAPSIRYNVKKLSSSRMKIIHEYNECKYYLEKLE